MFIDFTKKRLKSFINEINEISHVGFPYSHSKKALDSLILIFENDYSRLETLESSKTDSKFKKQFCEAVINDILHYSQILGFILRSTHTRNSFEIYYPILRLAQDILEPHKTNKETHLILSSEWDYSPHIFIGMKHLENYLLIGFPAPESGNPLLIPLAGHEIGHALWHKTKCREDLDSALLKGLLSVLRKCPDRDLDALDIDKNKLTIEKNDLIQAERFEPILEYVSQQTEETFCDLIGLLIFRESFLYAFSYLLSPSIGGGKYHTGYYPSLLTRVKNILHAADTYSISFNNCESFEDVFLESEDLLHIKEKERLSIEISNKTLTEILDELIHVAKEHIDKSNIVSSSEQEVEEIFDSYRKMVPYNNAKTLSDIINAAWRAYFCPDLWLEIPQIKNGDISKDSVLNDLVIKNIEILDIEYLLTEKPS